MSRAGIQWNEIDRIRDLLAAPSAAGRVHAFSFRRARTTPRASSRSERFAAALARSRCGPAMLHAENSAAVEHRGPSPWTVARPGIFLYGVGSGNSPAIAPEPVVSVRARIVDLRTIRGRRDA